MKTVVYSCPFVPAEWLAAHGLQPSRILPRPISASGSPGARAGVCPYTWAFVQTVRSHPEAGAAVFTTTCDQMRRASEWIGCDGRLQVFLMNVPSTWQTAAAHGLYVSELRRLGRFLVRLGGTEPSPDKLAEVMREYDAMRSALRAAAGRLTPRGYSEAIARFHQERSVSLDRSEPTSPAGVPVALVGGPLLAHHLRIFDLVEKYGGTVVLDGTTSGERTLPAPFDRRALSDDPLRALADAYFGSIPDAFRRPNSRLYEWLRGEISRRGVRGIIFRSYTWCDTWHAEAQRMKEWSEVPVLTMTGGDDEHIDAHGASRIEAFLEMLIK